MKKWNGNLTRQQAIRLIDRATCRDDPYWENVVADYYDEQTDTMPTIYDVMSALGVSEYEYETSTKGLKLSYDFKSFPRCQKNLQSKAFIPRPRDCEECGSYSACKAEVLL